jgi:hypothetical protein
MKIPSKKIQFLFLSKVWNNGHLRKNILGSIMWGIHRGLFVVLVLCSSVCIGAESEYHIFTDLQDRVVTAKIINVDEQRGLVELERENKRHVKVKPSVFIEADQAYIRDWAICSRFMSSSGLRFFGEKEVVEDWSDSPGTGINREFEKNVYNCELKNGSTVAFVNIKVEYCVYWVQESQQNGEEQRLEQDYSGRYEIPRIEPRSSAKFQTTPVTLVCQSLQGGYYYREGGSDRQNSKMKGVWVKVSMTPANGKTISREFGEPASVMKHQVWKSPAKQEIKPKSSGSKKKKKKKKKKA